MNSRISTLTYAILSAAALGLVRPALGQTASASLDANGAAIAAPKEVDQGPEDAAPRGRRKEIRVERRAPGGRVHIEERNENGDVVRESTTDGGEVRIERRYSNKGPGEDQDVIIRRAPKGSMRADVRPLRAPEGPFALAFPPRGEFTKEKAEHLEEAIRHLHGAGMDGLADRLQLRLDALRAEHREAPELDNLRAELDRLKDEHKKLQQELRKMQKMLNKPEKGEKE